MSIEKLVGSATIRSKLRRQERMESVKQYKNKLPVYTKDQLRKIRMPYYQAVLINLKESGFENSADFLGQLIDLEVNQKKFPLPGQLKSQPLLINDRTLLDKLDNVLRNAETAHLIGNYELEIDCFISLGVFLLSGQNGWWWIAEQVFYQIIKIANVYDPDGEFRNAAASYLFGKYLIESSRNKKLGLQLLYGAREISRDKSFNVSKYTNKKEHTIFIEACTFIYNTLANSIELLLSNGKVTDAFELCLHAKEIGLECCICKGDIYLLQGRCEVKISRPDLAVVSFSQSFLIYKKINEVEKACEAKVHLALAYLDMGNWLKTSDELNKLLDYATEHEMTRYVGYAHMYKGQYYLNHGYPEKATPSLVRALLIFHELNDFANYEFIENLACVSKGQELLHDFTRLILKSKSSNMKKQSYNIQKLVAWKDSRSTFHENISESISSLEFTGTGMTSVLQDTEGADEEEADEEGEAEEEDAIQDLLISIKDY